MSFHTITMLVRFAVTAIPEQAQYLDELRAIPLSQRKDDQRVINLVKGLKEKWQKGSKIERLATFGWIEGETIELFCNMLDQLDTLREQYACEVARNGQPTELKDEFMEDYEKKSREVRKEIYKNN